MIEIIGIAIGSIATLSTGLYFLFKEFKQKKAHFREKFDKRWGNEGDIAGFRVYSHYISLDLSVDKEDGEIVGHANTRPLNTDEDVEYNLISVNGKLLYNSALVSLRTVRGRSVVEYGKVRIKLKGKYLFWKLLRGDQTVLPKKAILWSDSNWSFVREPGID